MRLIPFNFSRTPDPISAFFEAAATVPAWSPRLDLHEDADKVTVKVDLPGVDRKDVTVALEDGLLSISGRREAEHQAQDAARTWHRVERLWGSFERHVRLGDGVDANRVKAELRDGVLTVTVPKAEAAKPRTIEIQ